VNPGLEEETGQTARSLITALGSQPFALSMIISNFLLLGFVWYTQIESDRQRAIIAQDVLHMVEQNNMLLSKCVVPDVGKGERP